MTQKIKKTKPVTAKIGIKEGMRSIFINAPADAVEEITSPLLELAKKCTGKFDYIHLFVKTQKEFHRQFPKCKKHLQQPGMLWVSWPKSKGEDTDLNLKLVIQLGYEYGLVESKCISITATWSALKFTWPREKEYHNSYGELK